MGSAYIPDKVESILNGTNSSFLGSSSSALGKLNGSSQNSSSSGSPTINPQGAPQSIWKDNVNGRIKKGIHELFSQNEKEIFRGSNTNILRNGYTSFSGADTTVSILFKQGIPVILGECQTITYSLFAPMSPVFTLGSRKASGFIRGPRTIAGSIIFTIFDRHTLLSAFHKAYGGYKDSICLDMSYLPDELPPFDIQVTFLNEYGQSAGLTIHDVRITTEGQVMSIEDMITENTMQYVATDITLMQPNFVDEPVVYEEGE